MSCSLSGFSCFSYYRSQRLYVSKVLSGSAENRGNGRERVLMSSLINDSIDVNRTSTRIQIVIDMLDVNDPAIYIDYRIGLVDKQLIIKKNLTKHYLIMDIYESTGIYFLIKLLID